MSVVCVCAVSRHADSDKCCAHLWVCGRTRTYIRAPVCVRVCVHLCPERSGSAALKQFLSALVACHLLSQKHHKPAGVPGLGFLCSLQYRQVHPLLVCLVGVRAISRTCHLSRRSPGCMLHCFIVGGALLSQRRKAWMAGSGSAPLALCSLSM